MVTAFAGPTLRVGIDSHSLHGSTDASFGDSHVEAFGGEVSSG